MENGNNGERLDSEENRFASNPFNKEEGRIFDAGVNLEQEEGLQKIQMDFSAGSGGGPTNLINTKN
jgi:hypothetical protein